MLERGTTYENLVTELQARCSKASAKRITKNDIQNLTRGSGLFQLPTIFALQSMGLLPEKDPGGGNRPRDDKKRARKAAGG